MGEENRGSSGGGTALLVIGIVAVLSLVLCCGGLTVGAGVFWTRSAVHQEMQAVEAQERAQQNMQKAMQEMSKQIERVEIPDNTLTPPLPSAPSPPETGDLEKKP
jgi:type II secretory pathway component PulJ